MKPKKIRKFNPLPIGAVFGLALIARPHSSIAQEPIPAGSTLPEVVVSGREEKQAAGYNPKRVSSPRIPTDRLETPQTITVVPRELMDDQGATTLREALKDVSGISIAAGEGGNQGDNLTLRGFSARSDLFMDGMRDFGSYYRDPFNLEGVEVLKGPSSSFFGRGSTGGAINQVSKTPHAQNKSEVAAAIGSDFTRRATADFNKDLGDGMAFRLNVVAHQNYVAGREVAENRRFGLAPSLTLGLETQTRYTFSYLHLASNDVPDYGIPYFASRPAAVDRTNYYGFEHANFLDTNVDVATFKIEHDFDKQTTLRNQLRYGNYDRDTQITEAQIPAGTPITASLDSISVNRNQIAVSSTETTLDNDLSITTRFATGDFAHSAVVGAEFIRETSDPVRTSFTGVPTTNLVNPDPSEPFSGTGAISSRVKTSVVTLAGYAGDSIQLTDAWSINGGLRFDRVIAKYESFVGTISSFSRNDNNLSWRAGAVYKLADNSSLYAAYGTSFNPSAEQLSLAANNANIEPEKNRTAELGSKTDWLGGDLTVEAAIFRIEKTNARTTDPLNPALNVLSGLQRVDGGEIGITGKPHARLKIFTGYAYLEAKVVESNRAGEPGNWLNNVPKHTFTLFTTYDLSQKFQVGGGAYAISSRKSSTVPDAATGLIREVPGYTTFSLMGKYRIRTDVDLQLNVYNLADTVYYDGVHPGHVNVGAGRSALLTLHFLM